MITASQIEAARKRHMKRQKLTKEDTLKLRQIMSKHRKHVRALWSVHGEGLHRSQPNMKWNRKLRVTAGKFTWAGDGAGVMGGHIQLSPWLYLRMTSAERKQTTLHELAHAIANWRHETNCKHDGRWRAVMRELGLEPEVYHSVNCAGLRNRRTRYTYACDQCGFEHTWGSSFETSRKKTTTGMIVCIKCRQPTYPVFIRKEQI